MATESRSLHKDEKGLFQVPGNLADEPRTRLVDGEGSCIVRENSDNRLSLLQRFQVITILWVPFRQFFKKFLGFRCALAGKLRTIQVGLNSPQIEQHLGAVDGIRQRIRIMEG